jgi:hypothetical protein
MRTLFLFSALLFLNFMPTQAQRIRGNGNVQAETRALEGFTSIQAGGAFDVYFKAGNGFHVVVEADENLLPYLETKVSGGTLYLHSRASIQRPKALNVYIELPLLTSITLSGAADGYGEGTFYSEDLTINLSGASDLEMDLEASQLHVQQSGSSDLNIGGVADALDLKISGSSDFKGQGLRVRQAQMVLSGASDAKVYCEEALEVSASGSSDVVCWGRPPHSQVSTSGAADVIMVD